MAVRGFILFILFLFSTVGRAAQNAQQGTGVAHSQVQLSPSARVRRLNGDLGKCACKLDANSREADEKVIGQVTLKDLHGDPLVVSVVNEEFALRIFQEMTSQGKIPFGYPEDGCFARAHEMSYQLTKQKIYTGKVFATGKFRIDSEKAENGRVTWGFHVAPFLIVDNGEGRSIWVIDPSLFYEPTPLTSWVAKLTTHPSSKLNDLFLTTKFIYHPNRRDLRLKAFDPRDLVAAHKMMKTYLKAEVRREHAPADEGR